MALFDKGFKGNLWTGIAIGVGASILAPAIMPVLGGIVKPIAKSALKGWLILREKGTGIIAARKKAVPARAEETPAQAEKPKLKTLTGKVREVDTGARTVTIAKKVRGKEVETVMNIDEKAIIKMGLKKKEFTDVTEGNKVVIKYIESAGKKLSKSLALMPLQKKAQAPKKMESS
jgi:hypothetical protein